MIYNLPRAKKPEGLWLMNEHISITNNPFGKMQTINFTSNGTSFSGLQTVSNRTGPLVVHHLRYIRSDSTYEIAYVAAYNAGTLDTVKNAWNFDYWRKVQFEEEPTGTLLTWLQANAVKQ